MQAQCVRANLGDTAYPDNGKRRMYRQGETADIDPRMSCAVHFRFDKNPGVEHEGYILDDEYFLYNKIEENKKPKRVIQVPETVVGSPEAKDPDVEMMKASAKAAADVAAMENTPEGIAEKDKKGSIASILKKTKAKAKAKTQ